MSAALLPAPPTARGLRLAALGRPASRPGDTLAGCLLGARLDLVPGGQRFRASAVDGRSTMVEALSGPAGEARADAARIVRGLRHPHLETVHAVESDGRHAAVATLVPGQNLAAWLQRCDAMPWRRALRLVHALADGLRSAAAAGLAHGDIHAGRISVGSASAPPVLAGFGMAGEPCPDCLAPERSCGAPASAAADIYALGCILYQAITGRPPFGPASALAMAEAHAALRRPDVRAVVSDVPAPVAAWIQRAMAIDPRNRPAGWDTAVLQLRSLIMAG